MYRLRLAFLGICFSSFLIAQDVNEKVVNFADSKMGKKVDRGECWDLVAEALNYAEADWEMPLDFGTELHLKKDELQAGDIIEFKNVKFEGENYAFTFLQHYAIVYKVISKDRIIIAHQNHNNKRKVDTLELVLDDLVKGKMIFYRPQ